MNQFRRAAVLALLSLLAGVTSLHAQRDANVPDPDPEIERKSFQVTDGFEVNLFAADPLLAKPIQMNFDPKGRLWVATSETYPQVKPGQKPNDKIIVLEDSKGEGKADKVTVFADGLLIPTGIEPGDGGCYVADSTDLLHLADTKGTGKADRRRVMLSGFGTEDTHHIVHTFRWGPDGMLYFNQSIYIHSHIETPHGVRRLNAGGVWQFRPETMKLEVFLRGFCNPWGHAFDRWGQSFVTDGANGEGINYGLPGAYYVFAKPDDSHLLAGLNPGSPKHCGLEILSGRHLPDDWQGNMITNDFRGHRVCRFVVSEDGAGYASREKPELIKTNHPAFRPVDVKMGPDGAIYIADWYNPIIQHGEVDFRDPRRDLTHGRIWRVTRKGRPLVKRPQLDKAKVEDLLEALKAPEDWTRHQAKRVLKERGVTEVLPALAQWAGALDARDAEHEHHLLEALWTYQSLDTVEPKLLEKLLRAKDPRARAAAVRVVAAWHDHLDHPMELLAARVLDDHPRVRLEAVRALGEIPNPRSVEIAMQALDKPVDKFLDYALWLTAHDLEPQWMPGVKEGKLTFGGNVRHLIVALLSVDSSAVVPLLVEVARAGKVPADREEAVMTVIAARGGPRELGMILESVVGGRMSAERQEGLLNSLAQATRQRNVRPAGDLSQVGKLLTSDSPGLRAAAARAAGQWGIGAVRPQLLELARGATTAEALRQAAFEALALLGGRESREAFESLAGEKEPLAVRRRAVMALASLDLDAAARLAADVLAAHDKGTDPTDVFTTFLERKNGAAALAQGLGGRKLPADVAKVGVRVARTTAREAPALIEALTKAGSLAAVARPLSAVEMKQMVEDVAKLGDPARGEKVFRRADLLCLKCHAIAGAGGLAGPDLVSIGASAPVDYLIDSILLPSKAIKENYNTLVVETKKGLVVSGVKVREGGGMLVLRNGEDKEVAIPINQIDSRENSKKSLMPEGLADALTRGELIDLVRFLSELGKVGPYSVSKARLMRRWQALEPTREAYTLLIRTSHASAAGNDPALTWSPAYSTVAGDLPPDALPLFKMGTGADKQVVLASFVRCQLDASTGGKAKLLLNSAKGLKAWLDGEPVEAKEEMVLDLGVGPHTLTFALDRAARTEPLRVELDDVAGSPARVRVVGGK
ncbi:MAG TPA: PVC-type heme-binding CxxCH protein [Gemmataceae bacterium]|nr:PVC-type heme-binding CxxCH protein [Gemmataceae bacterium]